MAAVGRMAKSEDTQMQDTGTRILGEWMSADAGPVLIEIATDPKSSYRVRALRGYLRLPRQFGQQMPDKRRVDMCRKAWDAAERDAERELVFEVIQRYPSTGMLDLAIEASKEGPLKDKAAAIAAEIKRKLDSN